MSVPVVHPDDLVSALAATETRFEVRLKTVAVVSRFQPHELKRLVMFGTSGASAPTRQAGYADVPAQPKRAQPTEASQVIPARSDDPDERVWR